MKVHSPLSPYSDKKHQHFCFFVDCMSDRFRHCPEIQDHLPTGIIPYENCHTILFQAFLLYLTGCYRFLWVQDSKAVMELKNLYFHTSDSPGIFQRILSHWACWSPCCLCNLYFLVFFHILPVYPVPLFLIMHPYFFHWSFHPLPVSVLVLYNSNSCHLPLWYPCSRNLWSHHVPVSNHPVWNPRIPPCKLHNRYCLSVLSYPSRWHSFHTIFWPLHWLVHNPVLLRHPYNNRILLFPRFHSLLYQQRSHKLDTLFFLSCCLLESKHLHRRIHLHPPLHFHGKLRFLPDGI